MLDPRLLRADVDGVRTNLARRGFVLDAEAFKSLEDRRKTVQFRVEELRGERNARSRDIGKLKAAGQDASALMAAVKALGEEQADLEGQLATLQGVLEDLQLGLPNLLNDSVPDGRDEEANVELRRWGTPGPSTSRPAITWISGPAAGCSTSMWRARSPVPALPSCAAPSRGSTGR